MSASATAFAPATVANVAVGFDLLGFAIDAIGDRATVTRTATPGEVEIEAIDGMDGLPMDPRANAATAGLADLLRRVGAGFGFRVRIHKGIPLGSGMGGSAASAVAAAVAANSLLDAPLDPEDLLEYILIGEAVASGSKHADNAASCLVGGLLLVTSVDPPRFRPIPVPENLWATVVHPPLRVDTRAARSILKPDVPLGIHVAQAAKLASFLAACYTGDMDLLGQSIVDLVIEPQRARLIPGFAEVKAAALRSGALGCSIAGAGPAVFALARGRSAAETAGAAMAVAFEAAGVPGARSWVSAIPARGARVERP